MNFRYLATAVAATLWLGASAAETHDDPTLWVNPFVGTSNFGTTNPGAIVPNGMMSVVPFNVM